MAPVVLVMRSRSLFLLLLRLLLFGGQYTAAQETTIPVEPKISIDYLLGRDTTAIMKKIKLARSLVNNHPDSALQLYQEAFRESRTNAFVYGADLSLIGLGILYIDKGDYRHSKRMFEEVLYSPFYPRKGRLLSALYINLAKVAVYQGQYVRGYALLDSAIRHINRKGSHLDSLSLATVYTSAGTLLKISGESAKAMQYLKEAELVAVRMQDTALLATIYSNLVNFYKDIRELDQALAYSNKALALNLKIEDKRGYIHALTIRGSLHHSLEHYDSALVLFNKAIDLSIQNGIDEYRLRTYLYLSLGELYRRKGIFTKARQYLYTGRSLALAGDDLSMQYQAFREWSQYYRSVGAYRQAYDDLFLAHQLYDTILNKEKHKSINEIETRYRTAEKDRALVRQSLQLSEKERVIQRKNFFIYAALLLFACTILVAIVVQRHKNKLGKVKRSNFAKDRQISVFKAILEGEEKERGRMARELHDGIISQLTMVKMRFSSFLIPGSRFDRASFEQGYRYLEETMRDLRMTAHNLMPETVWKGGLVKALSDFCSKMDGEHSVNVHFLTNGNAALDKVSELSLYRIVQELVQNALKHAFASTLLVQVNFHLHLIEITVEDDGCGFNLSQAKGVGLHNVLERIHAMKGHVEILSDHKQGTTVYIEVPLPQEGMAT